VRIALAQVNATVGDIAGNEARITARLQEAREAGAALVLFPELALTGYPPEDLLLKTSFLDAAELALRELAAHARGPLGDRPAAARLRRPLARQGRSAMMWPRWTSRCASPSTS